MDRRHLRLAAAIAPLLLLGAPRAGEARACNPRLDLTSPRARFQDNGDGTATDRRTGLTWQRCVLGASLSEEGTPGVLGDDRCLDTGTKAFTWQEALQAAAALNAAGGFAGHADWRLPDRKELESLVERACTGPSLNDAVFPDTPAGWSFTSTPVAPSSFSGTSPSAHAVDFTTGSVFTAGKTEKRLPVRLVRG
jgi:hypothetical protein